VYYRKNALKIVGYITGPIRLIWPVSRSLSNRAFLSFKLPPLQDGKKLPDLVLFRSPVHPGSEWCSRRSRTW